MIFDQRVYTKATDYVNGSFC